jgi:Domain of unknown function (DUF1844)
MAEKKGSGFTVTDRRLFTEDGELRHDLSQDQADRKDQTDRKDQVEKNDQPEKKSPAPVAAGASAEKSASAFPASLDANVPPAPTAAEQQTQAEAYRASAKELDSQVELSGHSAKELEMTFERFLASLYMTAMLQLGLMHQQGEQPRIDIIGARQTIDTLSLLAEKTKGNLTSTEENFLQNSLYEVRMAYVEVTNALARPPQPGAATGTSGR